MVGASGRAMRERAVRPKLGTSPSASPRPHPLDSGFRRNDELKGRNDEGMPRMTNERQLERSIPDRSPGHAFVPMHLAAAHQCMKIEVLTGGSFATHTPTLDSGFRRNDD